MFTFSSEIKLNLLWSSSLSYNTVYMCGRERSERALRSLRNIMNIFFMTIMTYIQLINSKDYSSIRVNDSFIIGAVNLEISFYCSHYQ